MDRPSGFYWVRILPVEHPQVVQHYRDARDTRVATDNGAVDTERQRHAITSYRKLIDALMDRKSDRDDADRSTADQLLDRGGGVDVEPGGLLGDHVRMRQADLAAGKQPAGAYWA